MIVNRPKQCLGGIALCAMAMTSHADVLYTLRGNIANGMEVGAIEFQVALPSFVRSTTFVSGSQLTYCQVDSLYEACDGATFMVPGDPAYTFPVLTIEFRTPSVWNYFHFEGNAATQAGIWSTFPDGGNVAVLNVQVVPEPPPQVLLALGLTAALVAVRSRRSRIAQWRFDGMKWIFDPTNRAHATRASGLCHDARRSS